MDGEEPKRLKPYWDDDVKEKVKHDLVLTEDRKIKYKKVSKGYENRKACHCCRHRLLADYGQSLIVKKVGNLYYVFDRVKRDV